MKLLIIKLLTPCVFILSCSTNSNIYDIPQTVVPVNGADIKLVNENFVYSKMGVQWSKLAFISLNDLQSRGFNVKPYSHSMFSKSIRKVLNENPKYLNNEVYVSHILNDDVNGKVLKDKEGDEVAKVYIYTTFDDGYVGLAVTLSKEPLMSFNSYVNISDEDFKIFLANPKLATEGNLTDVPLAN